MIVATMFRLGSLKYHSVTVDQGGPVERIDESPFDFRGRMWSQANAYLTDEIAWWRSRRPAQQRLYSTCEGTGAHPRPAVARQIAVSEALERWAFHECATSPAAADYGFARDPSSNGMASFPGRRRAEARRRAQIEAVERFCVLGWWERRLTGRLVETAWPGVMAVAIPGPIGAVTCIAFSRTPEGGHCYGHAADESIGAACERAILEMTRHELVVSHWTEMASSGVSPGSLFERRALYFSTDAGYCRFRDRLGQAARDPAPQPVVLVDREIAGPWSEYGTVWRYAFEPGTERFWTEGDDYFFW